LLVDEELARAIRHESAVAVAHWWGVSRAAVIHWRKALGVGRTDNEGSRRLIQAAAEEGAKVVNAREWTGEKRERARRVNAAKGLSRNLVVGYHGRVWAPEDIALLGTIPDEDLARRTGRTADAVRKKRKQLGIPNSASKR
jgi:hypothetical protein